MKSACERCNTALSAAGKAFICSYECTFCEDCVAELKGICPNCRGELVRRPTKVTN